jgi:nucleoid-associated protein YgaU
MMSLTQLSKKYFKSTEEVISMFLGLVIVVVVVGLIFNFFQKKKGNIDIPGVSNMKITEEIGKGDTNNILEDNQYVVVKGDNLWKIAAKKYNDGYAWTKIAQANKIKNPSSIEVGQKLILPKDIAVKEFITKNTVNAKTATISTSEYKVIKFDSLWKIAVKSYGDGYQWTKIYQANKSKIKFPSKLEIGMMLTIPSLK